MFGPKGHIGQAPLLIHRIRQQPRIDTSAFSRLSRMPTPKNELSPVGSMPPGVKSPVDDIPIRHPSQVSYGLNLPISVQNELQQHVEDWLSSPDPIAFRRSMFQGLRSFAPTDYFTRSEIAKRVMQLWKKTNKTTPYNRSMRNAVVQKSDDPTETGYSIGELRRIMRLTISEPQPMELVWMTREIDELTDPPVEDYDIPPGWKEPPIEKAAGHKYVKRIPRRNPPPKYVYFYRNPVTKQLTTSKDLKRGAKFKVTHKDQEGHFEVVKRHRKKGIVEVKHDESGKTAFIKEDDLHRMIQSYHKKKTKETVKKRVKQTKKKTAEKKQTDEKKTKPTKKTRTKKEKVTKEKPTPEKKEAPKKEKPRSIPLKTASMEDLRNGDYDNVEGFGSKNDLEIQAAGMDPKNDYAVIEQPGGFILVSMTPRKSDGKAKIGETTDLKLRKPGGIENIEAEYVLMEADDLIASHNPKSLGNFTIRNDYPENVQERRYHAISAEQEKVDRIARNLDPAVMVNTNPDGVNGTPIITQSNAVLGGNGRTMAIQMAYNNYPSSAAKMKHYLTANAKKYGLKAADVRAMKKPALVRRVRAEAGEKNENWKLLGRRMNESLTQGLDPRSEEVAVSQFVTDDVTQSLTDAIEPGQTLADFLHGSNSEGFVVSLRQAGIIDDYNKAKYLEHDREGKALNKLNEDGRTRVERVLAARILPDADLLQKMNPELRKIVAMSAPSLIVAEQHGWPLGPSLKTAIQADNYIRRQYKGHSGKQALDSFLKQSEIASTGVNVAEKIRADPVAKNLLHIIRGSIGPKRTPQDFRGYAARAVQDYNDHGFSEGKKGATGALFAETTKRITPAEALDIEFGITPQRAKEKKDKAAAIKRAEAERKRLAKLQQQAQGSMFAASEYRQVPDLLKAMTGTNRLMNRAIWLTQHLVEAAIHHSTSTGKNWSIVIDEPKIIRQVLSDVKSAVQKDLDYAKDFGTQPINETIIRGLIQAAKAMNGIETGTLEKAQKPIPGQMGLFNQAPGGIQPKSAGAKPPGSGWQPIPSGRKGGFRRRKGRKYEYWYPEGKTARKNPRLTVKTTQKPAKKKSKKFKSVLKEVPPEHLDVFRYIKAEREHAIAYNEDYSKTMRNVEKRIMKYADFKITAVDLNDADNFEKQDFELQDAYNLFHRQYRKAFDELADHEMKERPKSPEDRHKFRQKRINLERTLEFTNAAYLKLRRARTLMEYFGQVFHTDYEAKSAEKLKKNFDPRLKKSLEKHYPKEIVKFLAYNGHNADIVDSETLDKASAFPKKTSGLYRHFDKKTMAVTDWMDNLRAEGILVMGSEDAEMPYNYTDTVLIHEMGHAIDIDLTSGGMGKYVSGMKREHVSAYAKCNQKEEIAESIERYIKNPSDFEKDAPLRAQMVKKCFFGNENPLKSLMVFRAYGEGLIAFKDVSKYLGKEYDKKPIENPEYITIDVYYSGVKELVR